MDIYLVGGAVRDRILGLPQSDRDWVVTGATPQQLLELGYRQVGADFPVFLHPESGEEYALARTERKTGSGYLGFEAHADPDVTLEDDLLRRDLTINAMAETPDGALIDPFNGADDIKQRQLRHVSPAFVEDPVRVLRVAKFMARYSHLGFEVAPETATLMQQMVNDGETDALVAERVWAELRSALGSTTPVAFFETLRSCGALAVVLPEVDGLWGIPQPPQWHAEIDSGVHTMMVLEQACALSDSIAVRFAAVCHDLGKQLTPQNEWPSHHGHEQAGVPLVDALCQRLRVPRDHQQLAVLVCRYHLHAHRALELAPATLARFLGQLDSLRRPERFREFLLACEADARGRKGRELEPYPQADYLLSASQAYASIDGAAIASATKNPAHIRDRVHQARVAAVKAWLRESRPVDNTGS